jgi:MFS superfamily sulfate permease-like transporter
MIFGTCPHLSIGRSFEALHNLQSNLVSLGSFAIFSLMTGQAIERASTQPINGTSIINERVNIATTLTLMVGLVHVSGSERALTDR